MARALRAVSPDGESRRAERSAAGHVSRKVSAMRTLMKLVFACLLLASAGWAADQGSSAARHLAWSATTLDKLEQDFADVGYDVKAPDSAALAMAFASARTKLAGLKQALAVTNAEAKAAGKAAEFAKNLANLMQLTIDRSGDLAEKRATLRRLLEDQPALAKTDFGKRLDEVWLALARSLLRQAAEQLAEKPLAAGEIDGEWNLQAVRFDQLVDEGTDEGAYLAHHEELLGKMRESGKTVSLAPLEAARAKVRSARHAQQDLALEKQTHANQVTQQNLWIQSLDDKAQQLNEAADQARELYDQAQDKIQQALDADQ